MKHIFPYNLQKIQNSYETAKRKLDLGLTDIT